MNGLAILSLHLQQTIEEAACLQRSNAHASPYRRTISAANRQQTDASAIRSVKWTVRNTYLLSDAMRGVRLHLCAHTSARMPAIWRLESSLEHRSDAQLGAQLHKFLKQLPAPSIRSTCRMSSTSQRRRWMMVHRI